MIDLSDPLAVLSLTAVISGVGVLITGFEWIAIHKEYRNPGLYSWEVRRIRGGFALTGFGRELCERLYQYPNVLILPVLQILGACIIFLSWKNRVPMSIGCGIAGIGCIAFSLRGSSGYTGADQFLKINLVAVALALASESASLWWIALIFIVCQLLVAYTTPGILRLGRRSWYDGTALRRILRQRTYGAYWIWILVARWPIVAKVLSVSIVLFECGFLLSILLPHPVLEIFLICGLVFHAFNAIVMGLNTFFWAFVGAYPAVLSVGSIVERMLY
ncbi:MAG: hypothetical protein R2815_10195 [Flavobacteriales bacterium]